MEKSVSSYFCSILDKCHHNCKKNWESVILNLNEQILNSGTEVQQDVTTTANKSDITEAVNNYFKGVTAKVLSKFPKTDIVFLLV